MNINSATVLHAIRVQSVEQVAVIDHLHAVVPAGAAPAPDCQPLCCIAETVKGCSTDADCCMWGRCMQAGSPRLSEHQCLQGLATGPFERFPGVLSRVKDSLTSKSIV